MTYQKDDETKKNITVSNAGETNERIEITGHYSFSIGASKYAFTYQFDGRNFIVSEETMSTGLGISASCVASLCG